MKIEEIQISYLPKPSEQIKLSNSKQVYDFIMHNWNLNTIGYFEEFKIILLNRAHIVLGIYTVSKGGVAGTIVDPKIVFSVALKAAASAIILVHNHPSGNLQPSEADKELTQRLKNAGELIGINVLDHLIINCERYYSFADEHLI